VVFHRFLLFTSLHALRATRSIVTRKLTVRPSVKRVICDKTKETCAHILIGLPHERSFILVFWQEEWLWARPLLLEILGQADPDGARKRRFSVDIRS